MNQFSFPAGTTGTFEIKADGSLDLKVNVPAAKKEESDTEQKGAFGYFRMPYERYCKAAFEETVRKFCGTHGSWCYVTDTHFYFRGRATGEQLKKYKLEIVSAVDVVHAKKLSSRWPTGTGFPRNFFIDAPKKRNTAGLHAYRAMRGPLTRPLTGPDIIGRFTDGEGYMYFLSPLFGDDLMRRYCFNYIGGILTSEYELALSKTEY